MLEREHLARSSETCHDLVEDQENIVLVAECTNALRVLHRGHQDTACADDRLQHDGSDAFRTLEQNLLLEHLQTELHSLLVRTAPGEAYGLRVENLHKTTD